MILEIDIPDGDELDMLTSVANDNKMDAAGYATSLVRSFLQPRIREAFIAQVHAMNTDDIKALVTVALPAMKAKG